MTTDSNETNPYRSPSVSEALAEPARGRFSWRIFPVVLLYLYGGLLVVHSAVFLFMLLGGCGVQLHGTHSASVAQIKVILVGTIFIGLHGCFAIALGRYVWKQLWRRSAVAFACTVFLLITVFAMNFIVDQLPSGEAWPPPGPKVNSVDAVPKIN